MPLDLVNSKKVSGALFKPVGLYSNRLSIIPQCLCPLEGPGCGPLLEAFSSLTLLEDWTLSPWKSISLWGLLQELKIIWQSSGDFLVLSQSLEAVLNTSPQANRRGQPPSFRNDCSVCFINIIMDLWSEKNTISFVKLWLSLPFQTSSSFILERIKVCRDERKSKIS